MTERETLKKWLDESSNIVFFGGAGVSTESHIPDFRSTDGLYNQEYDYPPETILSHSFYMRKPEEFYRFYRNKMLFPNAEPNRAHKALAKLEEMGKLKAVGKFYGLDAILNSTGVPKCTCGGTIKPDVVLYEEGLDSETIEKSVNYIANADVLIIGGTSLTVYPAAGLIDYYRGHKLILINKSVTPMDSRADLVISGPIGEVLGDAVGV